MAKLYRFLSGEAIFVCRTCVCMHVLSLSLDRGNSCRFSSYSILELIVDAS